MFRKQKTLQPKQIIYYLWNLLRGHKHSKEGPKLSNNEFALNSFPNANSFESSWCAPFCYVWFEMQLPEET